MTCFPSFFRKKRVPFGKDAVDGKEDFSSIHDTNIYTYGELRRATENFSVANKIGQGGFGSVYKGRLKDGTLAAIKVLSAESRQGEREFLREIEAIAKIKHDNLVKLHGCCVEANHRILVYGYLENNSLAQTLLGKLIGYLAPEYAIRGQLTRKADIYSFGVLLLEIVSGRCNTNKRLPYEEQYLLEKAWELYEKGELLQLVDALLNEDYNVEEADRYLKIALLCTQDMPKLRPSMSTVVQMLTGEIDVSEQKISKPGLLSELLGLKVGKGQKDESDGKNKALTQSADSGRLDGSSSSSGNMDTSHATMTFNSIYDRSN
ncbi:hypothetical protein Pint_04708 [Pistacia integerrima]|uniref:Uncharacterized protein n=1 Tax=Pistacia integerrima TaxID=434235 RepID=A0ACC0Z733_9ROSI|nr:hypothetical protein Pint_04708 [Pistacia integerrima]